MSRRQGFTNKRRWISPQDFADLRKQSGLSRDEAAEALDVTRRTIQNWETGGARIPWMAYRMLRILRGFALPSYHWEGWTIRQGQLFSPAGRAFDAVWLANVEHVFAQARLFRQMYAASGRAKTASTVLPFPDIRRKAEARIIPVTVTQKEGKPIPVTVTEKEIATSIPVTVTKRAGGSR